MALKDGDRANFETLRQAFLNGDVALVECRDVKTLEYRAVICAVLEDGDGAKLTPFAALAHDNPYKIWTPPLTGDHVS